MDMTGGGERTMSSRIKEFYLCEDTECRGGSGVRRYYWSDAEPEKDSPQKLIARVQMNILGLHIDVIDPKTIWEIVKDMS